MATTPDLVPETPAAGAPAPEDRPIDGHFHPSAGWNRSRVTASLAEVYRSIPVSGRSTWRKMLAFAGPGYLVAVGYMDPGNWATDLAGGASFGYALLSVILMSNLMAVLLQGLSSKLGIVTGRDLAQACRDHYSPAMSFCLWVLCELAIAACDLAEVIGSAIALNLLFGIPMVWGIVITAADVMIVLMLQNKGFRVLESLVIGLVGIVGACFAFEIFIARPDFGAVAHGFIPTTEILKNRDMLYIGIGILGATVMPHNLYLHSSIVQTRQYEASAEGKREAVRYAFVDSTIALSFALFINAAILIVAAATFHNSGNTGVAEIQDAYQLLTPLLGVAGASTVFALALLASGQNSTLTGTLAGQIVMEGFLDIRLQPWVRRLITRAIAIVPAVIVAALYGASGTAQLLVLSQVILSLQLSFAVFPLVRFTSDKVKMGAFVNPRWLSALAYLVAFIIAGLNVWLLVQTARGVAELMYARILVPLENSAYDAAILAHVRRLAKQCGSRLLLIHVADGWAARNLSALQLRESEEIRKDREYLDRICRELSADGFETEAVLALGEPAAEITAAADREHCDLIAMATHGHRIIADVILGSVASAVRHLSLVPVLLVRSTPDAGSNPS